MTNHWVDIKNADVILIMGGNAAEAHPCGFKWVTEAKAHNKAKLIVVDPRFTRSAAVADIYAPIRTGTDIAFLGGVINYLLTNDKIQHEYVQGLHRRSPSWCARTSTSRTASSPATTPRSASYDKSTWDYEIGDGRLRQGRPDAARIRAASIKLHEDALLALHARGGRAASAARPRTSSSRSAR